MLLCFEYGGVFGEYLGLVFVDLCGEVVVVWVEVVCYVLEVLYVCFGFWC